MNGAKSQLFTITCHIQPDGHMRIWSEQIRGLRREGKGHDELWTDLWPELRDRLLAQQEDEAASSRRSPNHEGGSITFGEDYN